MLLQLSFSSEGWCSNWHHRFPDVCPLARGARAGIRLPLPIGLGLAPTDHVCFGLIPATALPGHTHPNTLAYSKPLCHALDHFFFSSMTHFKHCRRMNMTSLFRDTNGTSCWFPLRTCDAIECSDKICAQTNRRINTCQSTQNCPGGGGSCYRRWRCHIFHDDT